MHKYSDVIATGPGRQLCTLDWISVSPTVQVYTSRSSSSSSEVVPHGKTYQITYGNLAAVQDQVSYGFFHTVFLVKRASHERTGLRVKTERTEYMLLWVASRVHENQSVQLGWVAVTAKFRDYIILVM